MMLLAFVKEQYRKLAGFSIVGAITTIVSLLMIVAFNELLHWNSTVSYLLSCFISISLSYLLNATFVWRASFQVLHLMRYYFIYSVSMIIGAVLLNVLEYMFSNINSTILSFMIVPITMVWNYLFVNRLLSNNGK